MKTKIQKTIIATSIAALFLAPVAAFAKEKGKWEYHEDKWGQMKSYGDVLLSQDSAENWGPWSEFIQPAAGGPSVGFLQVGEERYRPLPPVNPVNPDICTAGSWCGYVAYFNAHNSGDGPDTFSRVYPGRIALTLTPNDPSLVSGDGGEGYGKVSWLMSPLGSYPGPSLADSGEPLSAYFNQGLRSFDAGRYSSYDGAEGYGNPNKKWGHVLPYSDLSPYTDNIWWHGLPTDNPEVTAGLIERDVYNETTGEWNSTLGLYVAGIVTPQSHMDLEKQTALAQQGQEGGYVQACYTGNSMDWSGKKVPVHISVDFAQSTWSGSWNNGHDGNIAYNDNGIVLGKIGFNANGMINGANIQSTSISATDGTISAGSVVNGSFYGVTAGSIGGVSDITKTRTDGTYNNASNVGVFLVNRVAPK